MHYIHNTNFRMPVILQQEDEERWLNPDLDEQQIKHFLRPYDSNEMRGEGVRSDFIRKDPYDPSILERTGQIATC